MILCPRKRTWGIEMEGYIDIHSHILPGIDDGSKNFEMSMEMLRIAEENGRGCAPGRDGDSVVFGQRVLLFQ